MFGAALAVIVLAAFVPTTALATIVASGITGSLTWELDSDGVLTISGTGAMPNWFPQPMNRPPWYATHAANIKEAVISDGVTNIGSFAFAESALESVTFPNSPSFTTIGDAAFYSTKLTSVTIPASVTTIEDRAFNSNTLPQSAIFKGNPPTTVTPASNALRSFPNTNFTIYYQPANEDAWLAASSDGLWNGYPIVADPAAADNDEITIAKGLVENMQFTASQATVTNITEAKAEVETSIATLSLDDVIATVIDGEFTAAAVGTHLNLDGTNGSYTFTVNLNRGIGTQQTTSTLTLTITATPAETYAITVTGGEVTSISNSSSVAKAAQGATVEVTADPPPDGYTFAKWTTESAGVTFADDGDETTTFVMPASAVTVTAEWVCPHSWAWQTVEAATCVLSGSRRQVCSRCEAVGSSEIIAALDHDMPTNWTLGQITLAATCQAAGSQNTSKTCTRVGCSHKVDGTQVIAIDPTAHAWGSWATTTAATCTHKGEQKRTCSHNAAHIETGEIAIDPAAHALADVSAVAATCVVVGNTAGSKCTRSGCTHNTSTTTAALGHAWNSLYTIMTAASCNASGSEAQFCTRAGCTTHNTPREIPKLTIGCNSIASGDRDIPVMPDNSAVVIPPVVVSAFEVTVGPNPARGSDGGVNIFVTGKRVDDGTLTVFDATGNVITKINVNGNHPVASRHHATAGNLFISAQANNVNVNNNVNGNERRVVGSWDLRDAKGNMVSEGTYLLRGVVKTVDGKREKVSVVVGVR